MAKWGHQDWVKSKRVTAILSFSLVRFYFTHPLCDIMIILIYVLFIWQKQTILYLGPMQYQTHKTRETNM